MSKIYLATHSVKWEGSDIISIHKSMEAANAAAKEGWLNEYKDSTLGQNRKESIQEDGTFNGTVFDSIFHVEIHELKE